MNAVSSIWRQLVRRRLWPVAIVLVAALAAVPVLLSREPEVPIPPVDAASVSTGKADDAIAEAVVAKAAPEDRSKRRRVLGAVKDPFAPAPPKKAKKAKKADAPKSDSGPKTEPKTDGGGTTAPSLDIGFGGGGGGVSAPSEPVAPKTYYSPGTIIVRFGSSSQDELDRFAVKKLGPVPDQEAPLLIYMGLTKDGKRAKFLVDDMIEVDGDGTCKPHPSSCETIELSVGETEFLDVIDPEAGEDATDEERILAQFELDLVDIKRAGDDDVR
jgi:hypothetical protein